MDALSRCPVREPFFWTRHLGVLIAYALINGVVPFGPPPRRAGTNELRREARKHDERCDGATAATAGEIA